MSALPAPAVAALRAHELLAELTDIMRQMPPDDVAHSGSRALIGPILDAAGVSSVQDEPEGRVWRFEGDATDVVEPLLGLDVPRAATEALISRIQDVDPDDDEDAYQVQVAVADVLVVLERALPAVHEHLVLASLARLVSEAGLRKGKLRTSEGGGLVLEFSVRSDLEDRWGGAAHGSPTH